jgi:hypothetical protein
MMMKRKYIAVLLLAVLVTACELPDNQDPKAATKIPIGTLVTNAEVALANLVDDINVNRNINRMVAQYTTEVTYVDEARYNFGDRQIPDNYWDRWYRDIIMDLNAAQNLYAEQSGNDNFNKARDNKIAILEVMTVYAYQSLVDTYGDVPYTEALGGIENSSPAYDDAATIYSDLLSRVSSAISQLKANADAGSFGSEDIFFSGDVEMWIKAAASMQLRMGVRLADVNHSLAQTTVAAAISNGVLEEGETWELVYTGVTPHVNTIYNAFIVDQRKDYVPCNTLMDILIATSDPRLTLYCSPVPGTDGIVPDDYIGMPYGLEGGAAYQSFSHFSDQMFAADFPAVLIDYAEVQMLLAAANAYGFTTPMSAQEHYDAGVTASVVWWGGDAADAEAYLAADGAYDAGNWKESIGQQIWLVCYNRGNEGWNYWRQFDVPTFNPPENMTATDIPLRWPYPFNEVDLNEENYDAAAAAIGGDDVRTQLFWDLTPNAK